MRRVALTGLFGFLDHQVDLRTDTPTILTGPNGSGKTHVLSLLNAALSLDARTLLHSPYSRLLVEFEDGRSLSVERATDPEESLTIQALAGRRVLGPPLNVTRDILEAGTPRTPAFYRRMNEGRWVDRRSGRILSKAAIERRFGSAVPRDKLNSHPQIADLCQPPSPVLIDTKRLDVADGELNDPDLPAYIQHDPRAAASRIQEYAEQLRLQVTEARRASVQATQSADLSFAARALDAATARVREADLHERYDRTVERYETLARNSLAVGEAPLQFPTKTTPTVRRILQVFLDDWDKRLEPLLPLNTKIQTLREILDSKLAPSGKRTAMTPRGSLEFRSLRGARIPVADLSSGEQHLVALFTMLLFSAEPESLVLIDEPELSLHAAWKHAFLSDISRVAEISQLQVVLATHSAGIINGRWDLVEELQFNDDPTAGIGHAPDESVDEQDEY